MVQIKTLLPEFRKLVGELADDLRARSIGDAKIDAGLKEAFQQIERGGRTAQVFEVWREDYLDQVAVAWVLACVFVRFMEDNGLIDECWLAGKGDRRRLAEDTHELFFRKNPQNTDREYFLHVFQEVGQIPAAKDLFSEGKTPLWAVAPSGDAAMKLLRFWREMDAETGHLQRSFEVESGDTRFLGDLYQELSERAKKKFALLQTPVFVEEFILDRTLTPALAEFGLEKARMIDPTCGSGHFLLGGFARLFDLWSQRESNEIKAAQKALDGVWGVDLNPFAVAIARFRLIVAAVQACGIKRLKHAPGWNIHLASGDSLLFGSKPSFGGERVGIAQQLSLFDVAAIYAVEDRKTLQEILGQGYHVVVGNPPYITVKDKAQNEAYRQKYSCCHRQYSLGVPFTQRFWELAVQKSEDGARDGGHIGMITSNSFMKREFGKKLIEEFFPQMDLSHVVDLSGAYIPGHGTPTVILFGRNRKPVGDAVRAVLGIKGEPSTPEDASQGMVWQSMLNQIDQIGSQSDFTSTADVPRATFARHPWSIGGGGASDLKEQLVSEQATTLEELILEIGFAAVTREDDVYQVTSEVAKRNAIPGTHVRALVSGDEVRDWCIIDPMEGLFPYDRQTFASVHVKEIDKFLWPWKTQLSIRIAYGLSQLQRGLKWSEYSMLFANRLRTPLTVSFAEVASHNHFVLDRGGKVFKQTAPIIKMPATATEGEYLALLGLLNSSASCFWMKQVCHQKQMTGGDGIRISSRAKVPYQFAGTRLLELPIPKAFLEGPLRQRLQELATLLDRLSQEMGSLTAASAIHNGISEGESLILTLYQDKVTRRSNIRSSMVFLQEEIDFTIYVMFGLVDESLLCESWDWPNAKMDAGMRPFEILQQRNLDDFSVPKDVPDDWPQELKTLWRLRMKAIQASKDLALIEDDHYKRRWLGRQGLFNHTARQDELKSACESWLLDRLEFPIYRKGTKYQPELTTTAQMADVASADAEFLQVASLFRGRPDFDVAALVAELVEAEAVPLLPILRYKPVGLRKREVWERTWHLQRQQDAGKDVGEIPLPPKYATTDFLKTDYRRLRGNLDLPKERWVSFPHCSTDSDPSLVVGWAGWDHLEQATALIAYYDARKREGWDAARLAPLLAGLDQLLPWIHQWHPEIDPEFGETAGQSFQAVLENDAHELGLTVEAIRKWAPEVKGGRRKDEGGKQKQLTKGGRRKANGGKTGGESVPEEPPQ
jgi:hypothetical protein